jgi:hypothetical protein
VQELHRCKNEPRLLLLIMHGFVELIINLVVEHHCKQGGKIVERTRDFPHSIKLTLLNEMGLLSDHHYRLLNWLRGLRNDAAHTWHFKLNPDKMKEIANPKYRKSFGGLCAMILADLFNAFPEVSKVVMPILDFGEDERAKNTVPVPASKYTIALVSDPATINIPVTEATAYMAALKESRKPRSDMVPLTPALVKAIIDRKRQSKRNVKV